MKMVRGRKLVTADLQSCVQHLCTSRLFLHGYWNGTFREWGPCIVLNLRPRLSCTDCRLELCITTGWLCQVLTTSRLGNCKVCCCSGGLSDWVLGACSFFWCVLRDALGRVPMDFI